MGKKTKIKPYKEYPIAVAIDMIRSGEDIVKDIGFVPSEDGKVVTAVPAHVAISEIHRLKRKITHREPTAEDYTNRIKGHEQFSSSLKIQGSAVKTAKEIDEILKNRQKKYVQAKAEQIYRQQMENEKRARQQQADTEQIQQRAINERTLNDGGYER